MEEILCSVRNYTKFSGNSYTFYKMAQDALDCGLDAVITTDRNIYPDGKNQIYYRAGKRLLVICGEELFNPLDTAGTHYLSIGIDREQFNKNIHRPQDEIRIPLNQGEDRKSFRYIEIMNAQEILQSGITEGERTLRHNIEYFDRLLKTEQHYTCIAGTCSAVNSRQFSYKELFSTVCNHLLLDEDLNGDFIHDKIFILKALKLSHFFTALDGLADARGFRFSAEGDNLERIAWLGDTIYLKNSITLKINIPEASVCRLIRNGELLREWHQCRQVPFTIYDPGYYRVECALVRKNNLYDWIISNPIYVLKG